MRCEEVKDLIDFARSEAGLNKEASDHIAGCGECGKYYRLSRMLSDRGSFTSVPAMDGAMERKLKAFPARRRVRRVGFASVAGAAAALTVVFGLLFNPFLPVEESAAEVTVEANYEFDALESVYRLTSTEYTGSETQTESVEDVNTVSALDYYYALAVY